jgi:hypothetical protein
MTKPSVKGASSDATKKVSLRTAIWVLAVLFFLAATPFELKQSGFVYLVKAMAVAGIIGYAVLMRGARLTRFHPLIALALLLFLAANLIDWSDRAGIALVAILLGAILGQLRGDKWDNDFYSVVLLFVWSHVAGLVFAVVAFYSTSNVLDLHGLIFPEASRAAATGNLGRLSGFHTEPGTYSQWTLFALFLAALIRGELFTRWHALIAGSILLTFSLWGLLAVPVFALAFMIEALFKKKLSTKFRRLFAILSTALIGVGLANLISPEIRETATEFLSLKASFTTQSGLDKLEASRFLSENYASVLFFGQPIDPGFCPRCLSPQDSGLGFTASFYLGFAMFGCLMLIIARQLASNWNLGFVVALLPIVVWKAHLYEPLVWIIIGYILTGPSRFDPQSLLARRGRRRLWLSESGEGHRLGRNAFPRSFRRTSA